MSYNLYLKPREGDLTYQQLAAYFKSRPNYQFENASFHYNNGDTGVYFSIHFLPEDDESGYPLYFEMSFYRPSFFAFEAEGELSAFVKTFNLVVYDPEKNDAVDCDYDGEKFLSGWHQGNVFAYRAVHKMQEQDYEQFHVVTLAQKDLHGMWGWNMNRGRYQQHLGEAYYVPPIWPMRIGEKVTTATMWPDGIPTFIPKAKYLIIPRDRLGPKRGASEEQDMAIVPWEIAAPIIGKYSEKIQEDGYLINSYKDVPEDVQEFIVRLPSAAESAERLAFDSVLDRELWQSQQ